MYFRVWNHPLLGSDFGSVLETTAILDGFFGGLNGNDRAPAGFAPRIDITEERERYRLVAELPGVKKDDVSLKIENGVLTIRGTRKPAAEESAKLVLHERPSGEFERSLLLPDDVDTGMIGAVLADGVLTVDLPKHEQHLPREIQIR